MDELNLNCFYMHTNFGQKYFKTAIVYNKDFGPIVSCLARDCEKEEQFYFLACEEVQNWEAQGIYSDWGSLLCWAAKYSWDSQNQSVAKVKTLWERHKIWKNIPPVLMKQLFSPSSIKTSGRFFSNFVAFSENLNFTVNFGKQLQNRTGQEKTET